MVCDNAYTIVRTWTVAIAPATLRNTRNLLKWSIRQRRYLKRMKSLLWPRAVT